VRTLIKTTLLAATVLCAASCVTNELEVKRPDNGNGNGDNEVLLRLRTPGGFSSPDTRGLTYADENTIEDVYVMVFDNANKLVSIEKAEDIDDESDTQTSPDGIYSGGATFAVTLPPSGGATQKLVVLANSEDILDECEFIDIADLDKSSQFVGQTYTTLMGSLFDEVSGKLFTASGSTIQMWGETAQISITPSTDIPTVDMMRSIARVDVGLGTPTYTPGEDYPWTWDGLGEDGDDVDELGDPIPFDLVSVNVIRVQDDYLIVPNTTKLTAEQPSIASGSDKFAATTENAAKFFYSDADITDNLYTTQSIYVPEADIKMGGTVSGDTNHKNRMAVVVGGYYNDEAEVTYYRLDFAQNDGTLMDVLRNHLYQFNITKVSGAGYPDAITAYESDADNIEVEVIDWEEDEIGDVEYHGNYYMGIDRRTVIFPATGLAPQTVEIKTNIPDFYMTLDGTEIGKKMAADGALTYDGGEFYRYTLAKTSTNLYTLTITPRGENVSATEGKDRIEEWNVIGDLLNIDLTVDQLWETPNNKVYAAPGVIGIRKSDYDWLMAKRAELGEPGWLPGPGDVGYFDLTIRGSSTYSAANQNGITYVEDISDAEFGGLENEPVYTVYFKWGSMVAMIGGDDSIWDGNDGAAIVWVNPQFKGVITHYDSFTVATANGSGAGNNVLANPTHGHGDPCAFVGAGNYWRTPTGNPFTTTLEYSGSNTPFGTTDGAWSSAGMMVEKTEEISIGITSTGAAVSTDKDLFLPYTGYLFNNEGDSPPQHISGQGDYWTSTNRSGNYGYGLIFSDNSLRASTYPGKDRGQAIRCVQPPAEPPIPDDVVSIPISPYAGAFWRADQTGERLIPIPVKGTGAWAVQVFRYGDFNQGDILFSTSPSEDPAITYTDGVPTLGNTAADMIDNDALYQVEDGVTAMTGTVSSETVYLRIGLKTKWDEQPDYDEDYKPARYAVVAFSTLSGSTWTHQLFYLRQGHGADYLMNNGDKVTGGSGLTDRTHAVRFSPYNLTAETLNAATRATYSPTADTEAGATNPAGFTEYPTQVGAFWQWASEDNPRYAWDPFSSTITDFVQYDFKAGTWETLATDYENCPEGYRRPTNGPIDGSGGPSALTLENLKLSELRQSLFINPGLNNDFAFSGYGNYVKGHYADGFFDRRAINTSYLGNKDYASVSTDNREIASTGGIFINATTGASLFFSRVGFRNGYSNATPGGKIEVHQDEHYWTASGNTGDAAWTYFGYPLKASGLAIRCVKDEFTSGGQDGEINLDDDEWDGLQ
jgi:hypothetical protein